MRRKLRIVSAMGLCTALTILAPVLGATPATASVSTAASNCVRVTSTVREESVAQQQMNPQRAWPLSRGAGVRVAVVDTAIASSNPQLAGVVSVAGSGSPGSDCSGHGTRVAGIIAARARAGTAMVGMAPQAHIVLAVARAQQSQDPTAGALTAAINAATASGARVIVVPYAVPSGTAALHDAVRRAVAGGALVVAAAGSDTSDSADRPPTFPAAYPEALAVSGVDADGRPVAGSASGSFVDLAAPASNVTSTAPPPGQNTADQVSDAAAYVAGAAALLRGYRPGLSVAQVISRLELTASRPQAGGRANDQIGWGVVDAARALSAVLPTEGPVNLAAGESARPKLAPAAVADKPDMTPQLIAASTVGGAVGLILLAGWLWLLIRHRRSRHA